MKKQSINQSQKGSAIIVVLAFSAIVSMALLSMQNFVDNDLVMSSKYSLDHEYVDLLNDIKNSFGNESLCNDPSTGFVGLTLTSGANLNSLQAPASLPIKIPGANLDAIGPGWMNASNTLRFHSMSWEFQTVAPDQFARATSLVRSRKALYKLIVEMKRCKTQDCTDDDTQFFTNKTRADGSINGNAIDIPIYMHLQANGAFNILGGAQVVSCFAPGTGADFCESIGSVWNPYASSVNYMCEPKNHCYYKAALANDTCGTQTETTIRYKAIIEGKGEMYPGVTPPSSPTVPVPPGDFDRDKLNITNCSWCNPNI